MNTLSIVEEAAGRCARERIARDPRDVTDLPTKWPGEMYDADLDYAAEQVGRPLTEGECAAFVKSFCSTYARQVAALKRQEGRRWR